MDDFDPQALARARQAAGGPEPLGVTNGLRPITSALAQNMAFEPAWRTIIAVEARLMTGPFAVQAGDRVLKCDEGWLAREGSGDQARLWPVGAAEFDRAFTRRVDDLIMALARQVPAEMLRVAADYQEQAIARRSDSQMGVGMVDLNPD